MKTDESFVSACNGTTKDSTTRPVTIKEPNMTNQIPTNPEKCGMPGTLSDADAVKLQNLPVTGGHMTLSHRELECGLPADHGMGHHVQFLVAQEFGDPVLWWAAWLDIEGLRDEAAMFVAPICGVTQAYPGMKPGMELQCLLMQEHTTDEDQRHIFQ
jgi:hypothetical protein